MAEEVTKHAYQTFLGMNIMITGLPLGVFILFTITVLIFSLIVGLVLGLLAAVLFTLFMVGVALSIVLPFVFFTTMVACFLFLWGLGGYYIIKWANKRGSVAEEGGLFGDGTVGDSVNKMTGGLLTGFMDKAKAKNDIKGFGDEQTKPITGQANGSAAGPKKDQKQSVGRDALSSGSQRPSDTTKKAADATNAVKGGIGGATKLA